jgi:type VI protein secretion system component Hcp
LRRNALRYLLPIVAALGVGAAVTVAAIPGADGVINGCYVTTTSGAAPIAGAPPQNPSIVGSLRVVDPDNAGLPAVQRSCLANEAPISWNQQGPQGPQGPAGAAGASGPAGAAGPPVIGGGSAPVGRATVAFLTLTGLPGTIELSSYTFASPGSSGARAASHQEMTVTKLVDKASPTIFQLATSGAHVKTATITVRKAGKTSPVEYKLSAVLVAQVTDGVGAGDVPAEQVTLSYDKLEVTVDGKTSSGKVSPISVNIGPATTR